MKLREIEGLLPFVTFTLLFPLPLTCCCVDENINGRSLVPIYRTPRFSRQQGRDHAIHSDRSLRSAVVYDPDYILLSAGLPCLSTSDLEHHAISSQDIDISRQWFKSDLWCKYTYRRRFKKVFIELSFSGAIQKC